jgi:DNA (cytosine-5)-methyltransferase 1
MKTTEGVALIYVDLFCGAGGTSTGVESATIKGQQCAKVIACVNHDANAIASHAANHPEALHFTEDIRTLDLSALIAHVALMRLKYPNAKLVLWASLECTNFSKAKGGLPRDADSRTLALHLFRYIEALNPDYIQIENVEEFMSWGELDSNGKPVSRNEGADFTKWIRDIKRYGYEFEHRILNSADFGAYTARKRFFGQFAKHGLQIAWPEKTHCKGGSTGLFTFKKWKPVKEVLDFLDEGKSIFTRDKLLSEKTLERIYAGLLKFVAGGKEAFIQQRNSGNPNSKIVSIDGPARTITQTGGNQDLVQASFLSKYYSGNPADKNISIEEPAHAVTTKDHHSLIQPKFLSAYYGSGDNCSSIENPSPTVTTKDRIAIINPRFLDMQYGNGTATSVEHPAATVTTNPKHQLVTCKRWVMNTNFSNVGSSIEEPAQTITANRKWHYLMNPQYFNAGGSVDAPCFTLIARMDKMPPYLVEVAGGGVGIEVYESDSHFTRKIKEFMAMYGIVDIKMRMLRIEELKLIMGFPRDYRLIGTQGDQKKFIGNAVEVSTARALCKATAMTVQKQVEYLIA